MNSQILYNIQQADEIRKLKEERDQLLKALNNLVAIKEDAENDELYSLNAGIHNNKMITAFEQARAAIQNATR